MLQDIMPSKPRQHKSVDIDEGFYSRARWRRLRALFLSGPDNALCARCLSLGRTVPATEVHHLLLRRENPQLAYDMRNLEGLCSPCHTIETRKEQVGCKSGTLRSLGYEKVGF